MLGAADRGKHRNLKNLRQTRVRDQRDCQGSGRGRARGEKGNHEMRWPWFYSPLLMTGSIQRLEQKLMCEMRGLHGESCRRRSQNHLPQGEVIRAASSRLRRHVWDHHREAINSAWPPRDLSN